MPWPPEIESVSKIIARMWYTKANVNGKLQERIGHTEDEHVEKAWFTYKVQACEIMSKLREAGWRPPSVKDETPE